MPENGPSGLMSGGGKRRVSHRPPPRLYSVFLGKRECHPPSPPGAETAGSHQERTGALVRASPSLGIMTRRTDRKLRASTPRTRRPKTGHQPLAEAAPARGDADDG